MNLSSETMQFMSTAAATTTASGLDGIANLCDPTFSPDGTLFALSADCTGGAGYPVEFDSSNLGLYAFSETTAPYFTNPQTVITSSGAGDAIAFPSFSPDSKFIFYQRGSYSRAKYSTASDTYITASTISMSPPRRPARHRWSSRTRTALGFSLPTACTSTTRRR